jgi:hypothetical protein
MLSETSVTQATGTLAAEGKRKAKSFTLRLLSFWDHVCSSLEIRFRRDTQPL